MGARYTARGQGTAGATQTTSLTVGSNATTVQRNSIREFILAIATPSDSQITWHVQRCSALGTSTAVTPALIDPGDRAAQAAVGRTHTGEPTQSAFLIESLFLNARSTFRWIAGPGEGMTHAASVGAGIGWQALHATVTPVFATQAVWEE